MDAIEKRLVKWRLAGFDANKGRKNARLWMRARIQQKEKNGRGRFSRVTYLPSKVSVAISDVDESTERWRRIGVNCHDGVLQVHFPGEETLYGGAFHAWRYGPPKLSGTVSPVNAQCDVAQQMKHQPQQRGMLTTKPSTPKGTDRPFQRTKDNMYAQHPIVVLFGPRGPANFTAKFASYPSEHSSIDHSERCKR